MAKGTKAPKKAKGASKEILIVGSKMKEAIKSLGFMSSGDLVEALSEKVHKIIVDATTRAKDNDRVTVRSYDL
jgi:hypothetical protein